LQPVVVGIYATVIISTFRIEASPYGDPVAEEGILNRVAFGCPVAGIELDSVTRLGKPRVAVSIAALNKPPDIIIGTDDVCRREIPARSEDKMAQNLPCT
jgi:hypothetical protein